jgi:hypothetical protein
MRDLANFSAREWLQLLPLQHGLKQLRNDLWLAAYKRLRAPGLDAFMAQARRGTGRNIAVVIAFEQPWAVDWLLKMAAVNLADTTVLVFDNSHSAPARIELEQVCRKHGAPYLGLPANRTRHGNRSHGMAMGWVYDNVIRRIEPRLFACLDHDLIPVRPVDLTERLGDQPLFGMLVSSPWAWQVWAGYCMFDFATVAGLPLNFLYDFSRGLDTGGRNWNCLYSRHDRSRLRFASSRLQEVCSPVSGECMKLQVLDDRWLHVGGAGYLQNAQDRFKFCKELAIHGVAWPQPAGGVEGVVASGA